MHIHPFHQVQPYLLYAYRLNHILCNFGYLLYDATIRLSVTF
jgi:hypothetical protein